MGHWAGEQKLGYESEPFHYEGEPLGYEGEPLGYESEPFRYESEPFGYESDRILRNCLKNIKQSKYTYNLSNDQ